MGLVVCGFLDLIPADALWFVVLAALTTTASTPS
jgi:hypothetical protein